MAALYFRCVSPRHRFEKSDPPIRELRPFGGGRMLGTWVVSRIWRTERPASCRSRGRFRGASSCSTWRLPPTPAAPAMKRRPCRSSRGSGTGSPCGSTTTTHDRHRDYADDPRFVLRTKAQHGACPELVTPERVEAAGPVDTILLLTRTSMGFAPRQSGSAVESSPMRGRTRMRGRSTRASASRASALGCSIAPFARVLATRRYGA